MSESLQLPNPNADAAPIPVLLFTIPQVAHALQVSTRTVENLIGSGQLPSVTIGKSRRVMSDDLQAFARRGVPEITK